jgi:hypothetical protein
MGRQVALLSESGPLGRLSSATRLAVDTASTRLSPPRGAETLLTGDSDPASALARIVDGELRRIAATRTCA